MIVKVRPVARPPAGRPGRQAGQALHRAGLAQAAVPRRRQDRQDQGVPLQGPQVGRGQALAATNVDTRRYSKYVRTASLSTKGKYRFRAYTRAMATWAAGQTGLQQDPGREVTLADGRAVGPPTDSDSGRRVAGPAAPFLCPPAARRRRRLVASLRGCPSSTPPPGRRRHPSCRHRHLPRPRGLRCARGRHGTRTLISVTEVRRDTARLIEQVRSSPGPLFITQYGYITAVLLSPREYEDLRAAARRNERRILGLLYVLGPGDGAAIDGEARAPARAGRAACRRGDSHARTYAQMYRCTRGVRPPVRHGFAYMAPPAAWPRLPGIAARLGLPSSPGGAIVTLAARPTRAYAATKHPQSPSPRWQACTLRSSSPSASSAETSPA